MHLLASRLVLPKSRMRRKPSTPRSSSERFEILITGDSRPPWDAICHFHGFLHILSCRCGSPNFFGLEQRTLTFPGSHRRGGERRRKLLSSLSAAQYRGVCSPPPRDLGRFPLRERIPVQFVTTSTRNFIGPLLCRRCAKRSCRFVWLLLFSKVSRLRRYRNQRRGNTGEVATPGKPCEEHVQDAVKKKAEIIRSYRM